MRREAGDKFLVDDLEGRIIGLQSLVLFGQPLDRSLKAIAALDQRSNNTPKVEIAAFT